jgi:hypothetical protein
MSKVLAVAMATVFAWAIHTHAGNGVAAKPYRSTAFIAAHTNHVMAAKCRPAFRASTDRALWIRRHRMAHRMKRAVCRPATPWYVTKQIWAANILGAESAGDPWPNCPDPFDGGGSWYATVGCENNGNWLDSPGYYRCGLQFDPGWERRFGRLCP